MQLLQLADAALVRAPTSVIDKPAPAPSGDRHDFFAIGAYSWPNPETADGLPYVRRDGVHNPEAYTSERYDKGRFQTFVNDVCLLSTAFFYSGNQAYAAKAKEILRRWFGNPSTRMNPSFRYAAAHPGISDGKHSGIIEGVILIEMLDHLVLLERQRVLDQDEIRIIQNWFRELSDWLVTSEFGRREFLTSNNHGSYYLAQVMTFSSYAQLHERAHASVRFAKRQIHHQFSADGSLPAELARSNSFFYSIYGLRAFVILARASEQYGVDLWSYRRPKETAAVMAQAFRFMLPYLSGHREWSGKRLDSGHTPHALQMCRIAGRAYRAKSFDDAVCFLTSQTGAVSETDSVLGWACRVATAEGTTSFGPIDFDKPLPRHGAESTPFAIKAMKGLTMLGLWPRGRLR